MKTIKYATLFIAGLGMALVLYAAKKPTDNLLKSIENNNQAEALAALANEADATSGLYRAIELNNTDMAKLMLENQADVNAQHGTGVSTLTYQPTGHTPLEWALFVRYNILDRAEDDQDNKSKDVIDLLLEDGAEPNTTNYSPLVQAILHKDEWLHDLLLDQAYVDTLDLDIIDTYKQITPLIAAAQNKDKGLVVILAEGVENEPGGSLAPTLIQAIKNGDLESIKFIVLTVSQTDAAYRRNRGESITAQQIGKNIINQMNFQGETPLMAAIKKGDKTIIKWLLNNGASITPLKGTFFISPDPIILKLLMNHDPLIINQAITEFNPRTGTTVSYPLLLYAAYRQHLPHIKFLINNNSPLNVTDTYGRNILMYLLEVLKNTPPSSEQATQIRQLIQSILQKNINLYQKNVNGQTILHYAVQTGDEGIINAIVSKDLSASKAMLLGPKSSQAIAFSQRLINTQDISGKYPYDFAHNLSTRIQKILQPDGYSTKRTAAEPTEQSPTKKRK